MKRENLLKLVEELKKEFEGKEINCLEFDNAMQEKLNTTESLFDSNYDIYDANYSYCISLDDDNIEWLTIDYNITAEGAGTFDKDLKINEIYLA